MHPTPRPTLPDFRRNIISARSIGRSSMHREHPNRLWNNARAGSLIVSRLRPAGAETAMSPSPKSTSRAAPRTGPAPSRRAHPTLRLNATLACDTAFRVIARRYLGNLTANHEAACKGDSEAVHQMRVALTHLRAAILFFSPMVADSPRTHIRDEL